MTTKERRLLRIALVIFIGYMLPFQLIPAAYKIYDDYQASIEDLRHQIGREIELGKRAEYWQTENQRVRQEREQIEDSLLVGDTRELVGARMQSLVRKLAQKAGITFKTLEPPDTTFTTGEWVLVIQSMQFEATSSTLMIFLQSLDNAKEDLKIVSLNVRSYRDRLSGTIKITGFSRISLSSQEEEEQPVSPPPESDKSAISPPESDDLAIPAPESDDLAIPASESSDDLAIPPLLEEDELPIEEDELLTEE